MSKVCHYLKQSHYRYAHIYLATIVLKIIPT